MRRSRPTTLIVILVIAFAALIGTLVAGNSPHLGLDLQGGASVVLTPKKKGVAHDALVQAESIIRNRVDGLGVAEPDIHLEGNNIVVALPGVKNATNALSLVGQTAQLRFRPVLCAYPAAGDAAAVQTCGTYFGVEPPTSTTAASGSTTSTTAAGSPTSTTAAPAATTTTNDLSSSTSQQGLGTGATSGEYALALQTTTGSTATTVATTSSTAATSTTPTTAASSTTSSTATSSSSSTTAPASSTTASTAPAQATCGSYLTPESKDVASAQVVLNGSSRSGQSGTCYVLGPTFLSGQAVTFAQAEITNGQWDVAIHLKGGTQGISTWNQAAELCFNADASCPTNQIAISLDGVVESAPQIEPDQKQSGAGFSPFDKDQITISGSFSQHDAKDLALVLRYGSLPVELVPQTVQTVSATLGKDSLHAGLAAGIGGLLLVALYIIFYYRALGLVVILGMSVWSALNYSIITYLSARSGLALSLAGVTGIIVSVGVTVDSYVVFFERLKDEVRSGKTIRSSVDRGFQRAFRTIWTADLSSFMGAFLLYFLTVGSVRGFAFFLGLSTLLDVVVTWMFTRPLVGMLGRSEFFTGDHWLGVGRALGVHPAAPAAPVGAGK